MEKGWHFEGAAFSWKIKDKTKLFVCLKTDKHMLLLPASEGVMRVEIHFSRFRLDSCTSSILVHTHSDLKQHKQKKKQFTNIPVLRMQHACITRAEWYSEYEAIPSWIHAKVRIFTIPLSTLYTYCKIMQYINKLITYFYNTLIEKLFLAEYGYTVKTKRIVIQYFGHIAQPYPNIVIIIMGSGGAVDCSLVCFLGVGHQ